MLYLIRHGSVDLNGLPDPSLSAEGRELAARGARLLIADCGTVDRLFCSPLRRAVEHADIVCELTGSSVSVLESLEPEGDSSDMLDVLLSNRWESVAVIGHLPQLKRMLSLLISAAGAVDVHFENGGMASIELNVVRGELKGRLRWLVGKLMFDRPAT